MFVAMNRISVREDYVERFEQLFSTRAKEVDEEKGFLEAKILRPKEPEKPYIVMTFWEAEEHFRRWVDSGAFHKGHGRAFDDMKRAREQGQPMPMHSDMETFEVFAE